MPTPREGTPTPADTDFIPPPPKPEDLMKEDEKLRQALATHDYATFWLWQQKAEKEASENPVEHAQVLARAARILNAVNNIEGATKELLRAANLVRGKDAETEEMIVTLLQQFGGDQAVKELADALRKEAAAAKEKAKQEAEAPRKQELDEVNKRNTAVQRMLIVFGSHNWKDLVEELKREPGLHDDERARIDSLTPETFQDTLAPALKQELQQLVARRNRLMR